MLDDSDDDLGDLSEDSWDNDDNDDVQQEEEVETLPPLSPGSQDMFADNDDEDGSGVRLTPPPATPPPLSPGVLPSPGAPGPPAKRRRVLAVRPPVPTVLSDNSGCILVLFFVVRIRGVLRTDFVSPSPTNW